MRQICSDGSVPVDVTQLRIRRSGRTIECPGHRGLRFLRDSLFDFPNHLADDHSSSCLAGLRHDLVEAQQRPDQMYIWLDGIEQFRFEQQLRQTQSVDRVLLHHLHHRAGKVRPDIAEPSGDGRSRRPQSG